MLKSVTAINHRGDVINMELGNPYKTGFAISSITGLGAPTADINVTDLAALDGGYFNSARAQTRNIVMSVIFVDDETSEMDSVETTRQKTYKYFPIKKPITLIFETDSRMCGIEGYVETNTPDIFSNQEATQISIICPFPYFYDAYGDGESTSSFSSSSALFEFPFSNEITEEEYDHPSRDSDGYLTNWKHIEFGNISKEHRTTITYDGDVETGLLAEIEVGARAEGITIYKVLTGESWKLNRALAAGDILYVSTISGNKYARILRNGTYINVMNNIDKDVSWFKLEPGDNLIGYTADVGADDLNVTLNYRVLYEGV